MIYNIIIWHGPHDRINICPAYSLDNLDTQYHIMIDKPQIISTVTDNERTNSKHDKAVLILANFTL